MALVITPTTSPLNVPVVFAPTIITPVREASIPTMNMRACNAKELSDMSATMRFGKTTSVMRNSQNEIQNKYYPTIKVSVDITDFNAGITMKGDVVNTTVAREARFTNLNTPRPLPAGSHRPAMRDMYQMLKPT